MIGHDVVVEDLAKLVITDAQRRTVIGIRGRISDHRGHLSECTAGLIDQILEIVL